MISVFNQNGIGDILEVVNGIFTDILPLFLVIIGVGVGGWMLSIIIRGFFIDKDVKFKP